ncbi:DsbA family protein [Bacillus mesophilus]|uniref:DsbA family oxidoreductase n=1 Tax=Bacillus mesophilus TaxID=1808955 RepID=A0A6M0Q8B8_9BACI|nr:DsbA family oxidoreductase [Bacillus mesophilus]
MGKKRLEDAIKKINEPVEVVYRCFELDPNAARDNKQNIYEKLAEKYGMSIEQAKSNTQNMVEMAKAEGLDYKMDTLILTNTFDAHRLTMFAKSKGLMHEMTNRILHAFYTESKHIGDHETLIELAVEVGLNREEVAELLAGNQMSSEVRADEENAGRYGIRSIPTFIINEKYALTGAQSADVMAQALQQVLDQDGSYKK